MKYSGYQISFTRGGNAVRSGLTVSVLDTGYAEVVLLNGMYQAGLANPVSSTVFAGLANGVLPFWCVEEELIIKVSDSVDGVDKYFYGVKSGVSGLKLEEGVVRVVSDTFNKKVSTSHGVKVPSGVGIVTITADDPMKSCYTVLYPECKKRGIPFTLAMPSMISFISPAGAEDNPERSQARATDEQIKEMLLNGNTYYYHSTSHANWRADDLNWFINEAVYGAYAGDVLPALDPDSLMYDETDREGLTPGDRVAARIALDGTWSGAGAREIRPQGFMPNGQWFKMGEVEALSVDSPEFEAAYARWNRSMMIHGGRKISPVPQPSQVIRLGITDNTLARNKAYIDEAIATGGAVHFFSHEFLASGESYNTAGAGSAKNASAYPYNGTYNSGTDTYAAGQSTQSVPYTDLTGLLDYIQTKVKAGTLVALGCGAAMVADVGTPTNLAGNGDMSKANGDGNVVGSSIPIPSGWSTIKEASALSFGCTNTIAATGDRPYISVLRTGAASPLQTFVRSGWWTTFNKTNKCETFLLRGKVRTRQGILKPRIMIYGANEAITQSVAGVPENVYSPQPLIDYDKPVGGLFDYELARIELSGTNYENCGLVEIALNDEQPVTDLGGTPNLCSVPSNAHGLVAGDIFRFQGMANYTGTYVVHETTTTNTIVFASAYTPETVGAADYIVKLTWKYVVIPFTLPTPIKRCAVLLSITGESGASTSQVEYADMEIVEAGVR